MKSVELTPEQVMDQHYARYRDNINVYSQVKDNPYFGNKLGVDYSRHLDGLSRNRSQKSGNDYERGDGIFGKYQPKYKF